MKVNNNNAGKKQVYRTPVLVRIALEVESEICQRSDPPEPKFGIVS